MIIVTHFLAFFLGAVLATLTLCCVQSGNRADRDEEAYQKAKQAYDAELQKPSYTRRHYFGSEETQK